MWTERTQSDTTRSPRLRGVGFCIAVLPMLFFTTGCCKCKDLISINQQLQERIEHQQRENEALMRVIHQQNQLLTQGGLQREHTDDEQ